MFIGQRKAQIIQIAFEHRCQLVQGQVDAVIGDPPLRKIVGANPLAAISRSDQTASGGGLTRFAFAPFAVTQTGCQDLHRAVFVAMLRAIVLTFNDKPGGQVGDAHRAIGLVNVLTAGAGGPKRIDPQIFGVDFELFACVGFGQHRNRARRGVNATLRFGFRDPLHTVPATLELQAAIDVVALDPHDHFAPTTQVGRIAGNDFAAPAALFGKAQVHAQQVTRE